MLGDGDGGNSVWGTKRQGSAAMAYLVIHQDSTGVRSYLEIEDLEVAAVEVERLRNSEAVKDVRLCRLTELNIDFRPYYKVEVGDERDVDEDEVDVDAVLAKLGGPRLDETLGLPISAVGRVAGPH